MAKDKKHSSNLNPSCSRTPKQFKNDQISWNNIPALVLFEIFKNLNHTDRLNASSTCHQWRQALYHPKFWNNINIVLKPNLEMQKSNYLIQSCSHLVKSVTITYMPLSQWCISEFIELLQRLLYNYNLRRLILRPMVDYLLDDEVFNEFVLEPLLKICLRLDQFSLGSWSKLCKYFPKILNVLIENRVAHNYELLALASVKRQDLNLFNVDLMMNFTNLKIFSIDYDYVNDNFLNSLQGCRNLQRLVIHVHRVGPYHSNTTEQTWISFRSEHPGCELTINLMHSYEAIQMLHNHENTILKENMPLTKFKALFCNEINICAIHLITRWYRETLRSFVWIDQRVKNKSRKTLKNHSLYSSNPDPLIIMAWQCSHLKELILIGYKYSRENVRGIIRLRSKTLRNLQLVKKDLVDTDYFQSLETEVSAIIGEPWSSIEECDLSPVIKYDSNNETDEIILPLVTSDLHE